MSSPLLSFPSPAKNMEFVKLVLLLFISIILPSCLGMPILIIYAIVGGLIMRCKNIQLQARAHLTWRSGYRFFGRGVKTFSHDTSLEQALMLCDVKFCIVQHNCQPEGSNDQVECVFCLSNIEEGEEIRELRCKHLFHGSCFDRWLEHRKATCPLCRNSFILHEAKAKLLDIDEEELESSAIVLMAYVSEWMVIVANSLGHHAVAS